MRGCDRTTEDERRVGAALAAAGPALAAYAGIRLLGVLVLYLSTGGSAADTRHFLTRWDSGWYRGIAEDGYGFTRLHEDGRLLSDYVFFPLYPALERAVGEISGLSLLDAGLLVSWIASLVAAWGIFAVGDRLHGPRVGLLLVVIWAALPMSIVESIAYTESLFTALSAWCLYAVLRGRWLTAGLLASLAGLTRPVGLAVALAVLVPAVIAVLRPAAREGGRRTGSDRWWPLAGAVVAPLGWAAYVGWVGLQTGSPFGYSELAARWGNGFDGGVAFVHWVWGLVSDLGSPIGPLVAVGLVGLVWLCVTCVRQRQPLPLLIFCGVLVLLALTTSGYFGSKPRYLLPAFPLLLPLARGAARLPRTVTVVVLAVVVVCSAVYGAIWLQGPAPP